MSNIVYAIHNFEAENEDEINFSVGEPITVLEKDEKYLDGWWQGINVHGETGLFPMNYTSAQKPQQAQAQAQEQEQPEPEQQMLHPHQQPSYMPSPHLSLRSSGSTIEEEIDQALSQLQVSPNPGNIQSIKIELWDVEQVATWLRSVGLDSVAENFIDQEITGDILLDLNIDTLKELGITTFGKRYKIMQAITSLKEEGSSVEMKPTPNASVSTSAISRPASRKSIPTSLKRSNSQSGSSLDTSDALYQHPRKAPLPPGLDNADNVSMYSQHLSPQSRPQNDILRPISPQSLSSSSVSRSNTFNTVSSGGTFRSRELSPDPKGFKSPRRVLSQKSQQSVEKENNNDWMMNNPPMMPSNTPTPSTSTSTSKQPMQISTAHKLSVSPFEEQTPRTSTTEAFQAPEHEGWLHKQSDKYKTWNKRWFVLKGTNLFYFKSPKDVRMKGIINLRGYKIIVDETIHAGKYCFKAQHERERTFYFYTDSEESMRTWLKMLMKTTIARDFRAPVMSSNQISTVPLDVARRMRPRPPSVIMYKSQKQMKVNNDPKMGMLPEVEEVTQTPPELSMEDRSMSTPVPSRAQMSYKQTQESAIHPATTIPEAAPELPQYYPNFDPPEAILNEEEDLIDPQHHSLPLDSSLSITSSISNNSDDEWSTAQYLDWVNSYLPAGKKAVDLSSAFRNGDTLIQLLEAISGKEVRRPPVQKGGSMSAMMLDNIVAAFKFMGREGVEVDGRYTLKDVFSGNEAKIIIMLQAIKVWADQNYPTNTSSTEHYQDDITMLPSKKASTSVLIDENSGWRGSAMMDQRQDYSQEY
ncbi:uncharacterized protein B0P05DRAFT_546934 [Gilbertella persicaria]|uniref:uncharacterized protein n=1 Tax=Gilbertella persicaria TaxID=101096 RepID=UPI00221F5A67|nr:uncharacterized protein B0P05DRAFT_546934 [Gilbertella persicaria]KAI8075922.1 hypothetical protein B0P05DRAFT_546934 [Gilbertella persicaria]